VFGQVHLSTATTKCGDLPEHKHLEGLPGGRAIFTADHWASKVIESTEDE